MVKPVGMVTADVLQCLITINFYYFFSDDANMTLAEAIHKKILKVNYND